MTSQQVTRPRGRPRRFEALESLRDNPPANHGKRAHYVNGIGLLHGQREITAYVKIRLPNSRSKEIKIGLLSSFTWEQLDARRREYQGRADRGEDIEDKVHPTFSLHAEDWLKQKKPTVKGYGTIKGHVYNHLLLAFGDKLLRDIKVIDVDRWAASQRALGFKPATVNRQFSTLSSILNNAVKAGHIASNPARLADKIKGATSRQVILGAKQIAHVLMVAKEIETEDNAIADLMPFQKRGWLRDFILWALHSGMRRQEMLDLTFNDTITHASGMAVIVHTSKSGKSRTIPGTVEMCRIVERLKAVERIDGDIRLFPISLTTLKRKLTILWKRCGLGDVRLHDLRRTNATRLVDAGVDMRTVAGRLGHSNTDMLMSTYAVYNPLGTTLLDSAFSSFS
jgi:integrase